MVTILFQNKKEWSGSMFMYLDNLTFEMSPDIRYLWPCDYGEPYK